MSDAANALANAMVQSQMGNPVAGGGLVGGGQTMAPGLQAMASSGQSWPQIDASLPSGPSGASPADQNQFRQLMAIYSPGGYSGPGTTPGANNNGLQSAYMAAVQQGLV